MQAKKASAATANNPQATLKRFDIYGPIHKALRCCMGDTLSRLGTLDPNNDAEVDTVLNELAALLHMVIGHLQHENDFIHAAIDARRPRGAKLTDDGHLEHLDSIAILQTKSREIRNAKPAQRPELAQHLYSDFAVFVGENYLHMLDEETQNNAHLWALYSDAELIELNGRLLASVPPADLAEVVRWMARSLNVAELNAMFVDMRQKAPAPVFQSMLDIAQRQMPWARWTALARSLDFPHMRGSIPF